MRLNRFSLLICVFVAALVVLPVSALGGGNNRSAQKDWTILMYWDADNNLEFCTEFAMSTWERALTTNEDVNVVALVDLLSVEGTWIWEFVDGQRQLVDEWAELNTSDPATLKMFVEFGMTEFPAEKTMVVLQDHGYSWRGLCQDETNGDTLMRIDGLGEALETVKADMGRPVDLLAFDACNMMNIEVMYELKDAVPYIVGSQSMVPFDGLPYMMFLSDLVADPELSPAELAENIVNEYVLYYSSKKDYEHIYPYNQDFATASAVDTSKMDALADAFGQMADVLAPLIEDNRKIVQEARGAAMVTQWANVAGWEWNPDLLMLAEGLRAIPGHPELTAAIDAFEIAFADAVFAEAHSKRYGDTVYGLGVWFPPSLAQYNSMGYVWAQQFPYHAIGLDLVAETSWIDCLMAYFASK